LKKHSAAEVIDFVHKIGGVAAPVLDHSRLWSHPQIVALEPRTTSPLPGGGSVAHLRAPWHFSQTPLNRREGPPAVGQHTEEVLQELGYSDQEIALLSQKGVVRCSQRN
ncbi:MAG: CoA transferase, partial [Chloroflexi bacterium]|nr:CoA transferase [Chloroflexota bacterium]